MLLTLPQETLNEIIAHLQGEQRALQSLSLVDRRLTEECRRYLFSSVHFDCPTKFTRWFSTIPPGKDGLARYVRLLYMEGASLCSPPLLRNHRFSLRSFAQVEHLRFTSFDLSKFVGEELAYVFGHFSGVRSICIRPFGSPQSLLKPLALFPLLETTVITSPRIRGKPDNAYLPNLVCRGELVLKVCRIDGDHNGNDGSSISCFTRPTTCYRKFGLGLVTVLNFAPLERFFEACGSSLESVRFINLLVHPWVHFPDTLLSPLPELRELTLSMRFLNDHHIVLAILSSITSAKIDTITFIIWECYYPDDLEGFCLRWAKIENALCRLSELRERAECGGRVVLNVHFDDGRCASEVSGSAERGEFMPRFQEGGVVNVETRPMDMDQAMAMITPEEFR